MKKYKKEFPLRQLNYFEVKDILKVRLSMIFLILNQGHPETEFLNLVFVEYQ